MSGKWKTAVEAINNLDIVIEKWIETAEEMGRAIPEPLHYGAIDLEHVSEDENVPYYDSVNGTWNVVTECEEKREMPFILPVNL